MIETLLLNYPLMKTVLEKLRIDIRSASIMKGLESEDAVVYALAVGGRTLDGLPYPPAGNVSDKTATVASRFRKEIDKEQKITLVTLAKDITVLEAAIEKIDLALESLQSNERRVVEIFYIEQGNYKNAMKELNISQATVWRLKDTALEKMSKLVDVNAKRIIEILEVC